MPEVADLVKEARRVLRRRFLEADAGITGANFLVAETGSVVLVTNEGNGDLTASLPRIHIVLSGIEKLVPNLDDAATLLRLLGRSASGQQMTAYTTLFHGPRRGADLDGPQAYHVVLVDNGRSALLGSEAREILRCIRCGACLNHCPVYSAIGGHAYGWVYPGPMGAVWSPSLIGLKPTRHLPQASTFCGRCEEVCPMGIRLPRLLRQLRERQQDDGLTPLAWRVGLRLWGRIAARPRLYHALAGGAVRIVGWLGGKGGRFRRLRFLRGCTEARDFPAPEGETFQALWRRQQSERQQ
jgi:L-lactate dehydrogenase complex protein LldF